MSYGFLGRIIRVDLTSGSITIEKPGRPSTEIPGQEGRSPVSLKELPGASILDCDKLVFVPGHDRSTGSGPAFVVGAKSP